MKKFSFLLALLCCVSFFQSCVKEPIEEPIKEVAPDLPLEQSFIMPFDGFEDADTSGVARQSSETRTINSFRNWFYSASNVVIWNTVISLNLVLPIASFKASFDHSPVPQGNGTWLWAYTHNVNGKNYQAKLYGTIQSSDEVSWEMYLSLAGAFTDVLWYEGTTTSGSRTANWTLYHRPNNPEPFMGITYVQDDGNGVETIKYTNLTSNQNDNGSYIEFRKGASMDFNRNYDIYLKNIDNLMEIQWNDPGKEGRVRDEKQFNDTEWHCWDSNLMDVDC